MVLFYILCLTALVKCPYPIFVVLAVATRKNTTMCVTVSLKKRKELPIGLKCRPLDVPANTCYISHSLQPQLHANFSEWAKLWNFQVALEHVCPSHSY